MHGNVFLRFCIVYCSQGNREQPAHYLKQYKNAVRRFRVYEASVRYTSPLHASLCVQNANLSLLHVPATCTCDMTPRVAVWARGCVYTFSFQNTSISLRLRLHDKDEFENETYRFVNAVKSGAYALNHVRTLIFLETMRLLALT